MIVLDHHQVGAELPPAVAIVNPNRRDDISGQGQLAAVGVTFLAAVALLRELRRREFAGALPDLLPLLELVALGTVCDMVPLTGLNRAFVAKGLVALRHSERPGVRALIEASRLKSPPDCGHLGFLLGPRINAGGRIGEATLGARLLDHAPIRRRRREIAGTARPAEQRAAGDRDGGRRRGDGGGGCARSEQARGRRSSSRAARAGIRASSGSSRRG